ISKVTINEYLEKIEAISSKLLNFEVVKENYSEIEAKKQIPLSPLSFGLRRRSVPIPSFEDRLHEPAETGHSPDLAYEIVVLAKQLKESSLMMNQSLQNIEKILDSTEKAIEHSLASIGRTNVLRIFQDFLLHLAALTKWVCNMLSCPLQVESWTSRLGHRLEDKGLTGCCTLNPHDL
ncbi:hypothetical protein S245_059418, partial [Arachis hypogaea]